ncbi:MAG: hypothetical protein ACKVJU_07420 [Verrucomicrobiales bacterium]
MTKMFQQIALAIAILPGLLFTSCQTTGGGSGGGGFNSNHPAVKARNAEIALEPRGDYYIGRRWWTEGTRFWGYLRKPGQPWSQAKLVIINEAIAHTPDRLAETPVSGPKHGFDHNYEYRMYGNFTGAQVYDPNSNLKLPEFQLTRYEQLSQNPGFLFQPGEQYSKKRLPPKIPAIPR